MAHRRFFQTGLLQRFVSSLAVTGFAFCMALTPELIFHPAYAADDTQSSTQQTPPPPQQEAPSPRQITPRVDWDAVKAQLAARPLAKDGASPRLRLADPSLAAHVPLEEVARTTMPVLVINTPDALKNLKFYGQKDAYFAATTLEGGIVARISGTKKQLRLARPPERLARLNVERNRRPPLQKLGAPYIITRSLSATDLSFVSRNL